MFLEKFMGKMKIFAFSYRSLGRGVAAYTYFQFNYTLRAGKVANVVPTFKSGERSLAANYRPISLTCIVVKVIERLIHEIPNRSTVTV